MMIARLVADHPDVVVIPRATRFGSEALGVVLMTSLLLVEPAVVAEM